MSSLRERGHPSISDADSFYASDPEHVSLQEMSHNGNTFAVSSHQERFDLAQESETPELSRKFPTVRGNEGKNNLQTREKAMLRGVVRHSPVNQRNSLLVNSDSDDGEAVRSNNGVRGPLPLPQRRAASHASLQKNLLHDRHAMIGHDNGANGHRPPRRTVTERLTDFGLKQLERIPLMSPTTTRIFTWNIVICMFVMWSVLSLPFRIGFRDMFSEVFHSTHVAFLFVDYLGDMFFWVDIAINFRMSYMDHGIVHSDSRKIATRYLTKPTGFALDLIATLPYGLPILDVVWLHAVLRLPRLLRFPLVSSVLNRLEMHTRHAHTVLFVKLMGGIFLFLHWVACFYIGIAYAYGFSSSEEGWAPPKEGPGGLDSSPLSQYLFGLFWALKIMSGLGGEVPPPENDVQRGFNFAVALISLIYSSAIVGYIVNLIAAVNQNTEEFRSKMAAINLYMKNKRVPPELSDKIRNYYNHLWSRQGGLDDESTLDDMPLRLRTELSLGINRDVINGVKFFKDCNPGFIHALVTLLRPEVYIPGDEIMSQGDLGTDMYFISQGEVDILINGTRVGGAKEGDSVGEIALLYETPRTATVRAKTYCDVFVLRKADLDKVLKSFPEQSAIIRSKANRDIASDSLRKLLERETVFDDVLDDSALQAEFERSLVEAFQFMEVDAGKELYTVGEEPGFLHVLCLGSVEFGNLTSAVTSQRTVGPNKDEAELCGEVDFLLNRPRTQSCVAVVRSSFMVLSQEVFRKTLRSFLVKQRQKLRSPAEQPERALIDFAHDDSSGALASLAHVVLSATTGTDLVDSASVLHDDAALEKLVAARRTAMARSAGSHRRGVWTRQLKKKLRLSARQYRMDQLRESARARTSTARPISKSGPGALRQSRVRQGGRARLSSQAVPESSSDWFKKFHALLAADGNGASTAELMRAASLLMEEAANQSQRQ